LNSIKTFFQPLLNGINTILDYLNPYSENFFLKIAFVPSNGFVAEKFESLKSTLLSKIPLLQQISDLFATIKATQFGTKPQDITVTMPIKYGGMTYSVINFDYFTQYRTLILNFIRYSAWFLFLKKTYKRLPSIIYA